MVLRGLNAWQSSASEESYFEEREQYEANLQQETLVVLDGMYKAPVADLWSREEVLRS